MSDSMRMMLAVCLSCGLFEAVPAEAEGGRITFGGAVVVATCAAGTSPDAVAGASLATCDDARDAAAGRADVARYRSSTVPLDAGTTAGDPLLDYFVHRMPPTARAGAGLVTRVYE